MYLWMIVLSMRMLQKNTLCQADTYQLIIVLSMLILQRTSILDRDREGLREMGSDYGLAGNSECTRLMTWMK